MPPDDGGLMLRVHDLVVEYPDAGNGQWRTVVDGLSLEVGTGDRVGLVGESGSGKSVAALACLGLVRPPGRVRGGGVAIDGAELGMASRSELDRLRGGTVGLVFQEPSTALNPVYTLGFQLAEAVRCHRRTGRSGASAAVRNLLERAAIEDPETVLRAYPHQLSGGQLQRVMIALALAGAPRLLIADEPTSAVDLITQARLLDLLRALADADRLGLLLISHDLDVVAGMVDRLYVMLAGRIIEEGPAAELFGAPLHPYTQLLMESTSSRSSRSRTAAAASPDRGCRFAHRCPLAEPGCAASEPVLARVGSGRRVRCPVTARDPGTVDGC